MRKIIVLAGNYYVVPGHYDASQIDDQDMSFDADIRRLDAETAQAVYTEHANQGEADHDFDGPAGLMEILVADTTDEVSVYTDAIGFYLVATDGGGDICGVVYLVA